MRLPKQSFAARARPQALDLGTRGKNFASCSLGAATRIVTTKRFLILLLATLFAAVAHSKENGIESQSKNLKGHAVTIRAQLQDSLCVVLVKISARGIKYGEIAVTGFNKEGQEMALRPYSKDGVPYPSFIPGGSVGVYAVVLRDKEQLARVKLTLGEENQVFDLTLVGRKP